MAKVKKITKEELASINTVNEKINGEIFNLGMLEAKKIEHNVSLQTARQELGVLQNTLEEKYGKVTIDLKDGKISETKTDEAA
ncbi:hypothetical protein [uncultured virus]|jgi:hypothetical protein|uniref:Uncharacterized protein n=1 Tax=uncultured virus TaxID=340016 RepID=A0A218MN21_9VIRU|nr:hypothetical protein [uncultured virus]